MYFHENFYKTFSEFWRNSLKLRKKWDHREKLKNEKQKLLAVLLVTDEKKLSKKSIKIDNFKFLIDKWKRANLLMTIDRYRFL